MKVCVHTNVSGLISVNSLYKVFGNAMNLRIHVALFLTFHKCRRYVNCLV